MQIKPFLFPFIIIVSLAQGCSFSHSSESSSDSSGSSSKSSGSSSSSTSSESSKDTEEYQQLIISYSSAYLSTADFDRFAFSRGVSEIATANGITNWEDDDATLIAIGRALKKSNITGSAFETYKDQIANSDADRMKLIQKGYEMKKDWRGVAIFAKACFGHPSPSKRQKLNATTNAFGAPDVLRTCHFATTIVNSVLAS